MQLVAAGSTLLVLMLGASPIGALAPQSSSTPAVATSQVHVPVTPRELRSLCMDALGRPPTSAERTRWSALSAHELVDALVPSAEFWERWYEEQLYYFLLINNFRPQTERLNACAADLHAGRLDVRAAIHRIGLSSSFEQRNPGADTFVTVVLEQLAGLDVQKSTRELAIGKKVYDGAPGNFLGRAGTTQADVVRIAVESASFERHYLAREHERIVHAKADARELAAWIVRFHADPRAYSEIVREWLKSPAYSQRLVAGVVQENRLFVRSLYVDLLDRVPTSAEAEPLREALDGLADPAPLRSVIARLLLDSGKVVLPAREALATPAPWIEGLFARLLGRAPTDEERAAFVGALSEPACRAQTVVYALVSSAEYARY